MRVESLHQYALIYCLSNLCLMCLVFSANAANKEDSKHPDHVRTVLVAKMINYTYWPNNKPHSDSDEVAICLIANSSKNLSKIEPFIKLLDNRSSDKGMIRVKDFIVDSVDLKKVEKQLPFDCRIYYFSALSENLLVTVTRIAKRRGVLTISDSRGSLRNGTMVAFIQNREKLKLYINTEQLEHSGVRLKSSLLRIANRI